MEVCERACLRTRLHECVRAYMCVCVFVFVCVCVCVPREAGHTVTQRGQKAEHSCVESRTL